MPALQFGCRPVAARRNVDDCQRPPRFPTVTHGRSDAVGGGAADARRGWPTYVGTGNSRTSKSDTIVAHSDGSTSAHDSATTFSDRP